MAEQLRFCQHKNTIFQFPNTILNGILLFIMPFVVSHLNVRGSMLQTGSVGMLMMMSLMIMMTESSGKFRARPERQNSS